MNGSKSKKLFKAMGWNYDEEILSDEEKLDNEKWSNFNPR